MSILDKLYYFTPTLFYLCLTLIGYWVLSDRDAGRDPLAQKKAQYFLNEFYQNPQETWPLNKWDGIWYSAIASDGYEIDQRKTSLRKPAFFPLYPYSVGFLMKATGFNFELASAVLSVAALSLIFWTLREQKLVALSLLLMPTGFILVCPYPEVFFLLFIILQRKYFVENKLGKCFLFGFATGLTRVNAIVVSFAYFFEALTELFKKQEPRELKASLLATSAPVLGLISYFGFLAIFRNNFFLFFELKRSFGGSFSDPIKTFWGQVQRTQKFFSMSELWPKVDIVSEWTTVVLLISAVIYLFRRKKHFEAYMAIAVLGLSSLAGSFWGIQRYTFSQYFMIALLGLLLKERSLRVPLLFVAILMFLMQGFQFWAYLMHNAPSV